MGIAWADTLLGGVALHLVLCVVALTTGCGILRLLRIELSTAASLAAPFLALVFWTLLLGVVVSLRVPVRSLLPWFWSATAIVGAIGWRSMLRAVRSEPRLLVAVMLLPVATMASCYWNGMASYARLFSHDGWSYVAQSHYFWEYPRGTVGDLAAIDQFAVGFSDSRFIGAALLGVLSPLVRYGDMQSVALLFQSSAIYFAASAAAAFWQATTERRDFPIWAGAMFAVSGWVTNMLIANNYDNLLCLAYMPGIAVLWQLCGGRWPTWSIAAGCAVAADVYTYPELAPVAVAGAALISLPNLVGDLRRVRAIVGAGVSLVACAALFLIPFSQQLIWYFRIQFGTIQTTGARPGDGFFEGLVRPTQYPGAFWGLGNEFERHRVVDNVLGYGLSACLVVGVVVLWVRPQLRGVPAAVGLTFCGALVMIFSRGYAYGAYKFIALGWWLYAGVVPVGFETLVGRIRNQAFRRRAVRVVAVGAVLCIALFLVDRRKSFHAAAQSMTMAECRRLEEVRELTGGATVVVDIDATFAGKWATYYLRDCPTIFTHFVGYMRGDVKRMDRSRFADPANARFLLTDHEPDRHSAGAEVIWESGTYRLWKFADCVPPQVAFTMLDGEQPKWEPAVSLASDRGTQVRVLAAEAGLAQLQINVVPPTGESVDGLATIKITSPDSSVQKLVMRSGRNVVDVEVKAGRNDFCMELDVADAVGHRPEVPIVRAIYLDVEMAASSERRLVASPAATSKRMAAEPSNGVSR